MVEQDARKPVDDSTVIETDGFVLHWTIIAKKLPMEASVLDTGGDIESVATKSPGSCPNISKIILL